MKIDEVLKRRFGSIALPCGACCSRASPAGLGWPGLGSFLTAEGEEREEGREGEREGGREGRWRRDGESSKSEPGACDSDQLTEVKRLPPVY